MTHTSNSCLWDQNTTLTPFSILCSKIPYTHLGCSFSTIYWEQSICLLPGLSCLCSQERTMKQHEKYTHTCREIENSNIQMHHITFYYIAQSHGRLVKAPATLFIRKVHKLNKLEECCQLIIYVMQNCSLSYTPDDELSSRDLIENRYP